MPRHTFSALVPLLALSLAIAPAQAQILPSAPTTPGATGTIVTPGSEINITGGQTAGTNLFHSFSQFGLTQGQVANFQTTAEIKNVLARVNGGNPSVIDGLLKLTGSNASLYLMNPAGIIFGNNAQINIPGSFVATTATNIGIGTGMFNAIGPNSYVSDTPSSFVFQPGARGTIVNTAGYLSGGSRSGVGNYDLPSTGERRTLAFVGNTVLNLAGLATTKDNIALFAVPENASLSFVGSQTKIGPVDFNTIVQPTAGKTIMNLPVFSAFNIPTLSDLTALSLKSNSDPSVSSKVKNIGNSQVILADSNNTVINPGDLYSGGISTFPSTYVLRPPEIGSVTLLSDQNVVLSDTYMPVANNLRIQSKRIQSSIEWGRLQGKTIELLANGNIDIPNIAVMAESSLRIDTAGNVQVGSLNAVMPRATARSSAGGDISVRANTLQVLGKGGPVADLNGAPNPAGPRDFPYYDNVFSILASGSISIEQTGSGQFIEAAGLERDASGSVVYRLDSNLDTRVTIAGVKLPASETLVSSVEPDPFSTTWLEDRATGTRTTNTGNAFILKNVTTGELIQGDRIIIRTSPNPASLSGGGTKGLIGRLDKSSGLLVELSGTKQTTLPAPLDSQHPAMISVTSQKGSTSLANPIGGPLPGSYSNVPGLASVVKTPLSIPQPQGNLPPTTPDPVLYSPTIELPKPIPQPVVQTPAQSAPAPTEVVLYHRPVLSTNATRATLDTGVLKIEIDPLEQGILTLYRQPVTQTTSPEEKPKT